MTNLRRALILSTVFNIPLAVLAAESCRDIYRPLPEAAAPKAHLHTDLTKYVAGMEKSSLQKAAYAALARPGVIVDLGTGSGIAARDLAVLFPTSKIIGVDLDPGMVQYAKSHYTLANLDYKTGNAELKNFAPNSLDTIFMSSTAHHLTSYGSGSFEVQHVRNAIQSAHEQLKPGGLYILRDFLIPDGPSEVFLDLPETDGQTTGSPRELSTAALFEKFARDFRSGRNPDRPVPYQAVSGAESGWRRFRLSLRDATEFILRKDYRDHYDAEIKEEYTFMSQADYESSFRQAGFRIQHSAPIHNPWIVNNRFRDKIRITDLSGETVPFPATNYVIVGEKINPDQAIALRQESVQIVTKPKFLKAKAMLDQKTGQVHDVVSRQEEATDVLPYFIRDGQIFILSKQGFPRPILTTQGKGAHLSGVHSDGYVVEPISFLGGFAGNGELAQKLQGRTGIDLNKAGKIETTSLAKIYTSPDTVNERVSSVAVQMDPKQGLSERPDENYSGFTTSGTIRSIEANQVLRSAQAGSVLDARLELGVYQLLLAKKKPFDAWIGEQIKLSDNSQRANFAVSAADFLKPRPVQQFAEAKPTQFGQELAIREGSFTEVDANGNVLARATREYLEAKNESQSVMSALPVTKINGKIYVGLQRQQLAGVQLVEGTSDLVTNPSWHLAKTVRNLDEGRNFAAQKLESDFGLKVQQVFSLGGAYHSSPGITAETVHTIAVEVEPSSIVSGATPNSGLTWVALEDLVQQRTQVRDGRLLIGALRLAHATGLLQ